MQIVTVKELRDRLENVKGTRAVSIDVETKVDMNKTGNPYYGATKLNRVSGLIGFDYENGVNSQLEKEGKATDFVQQQHKWGIPVESGCRNLLNNKDRTKVYLRLKVQSAGDPIYKFEGKVIDKETIKPYLRERIKPATQANVDKEYVVRDYDLNNILAFRGITEGEELTVASERLAEIVKDKVVEAVVVQ